MHRLGERAGLRIWKPYNLSTINSKPCNDLYAARSAAAAYGARYIDHASLLFLRLWRSKLLPEREKERERERERGGVTITFYVSIRGFKAGEINSRARFGFPKTRRKCPLTGGA